VSTLEITLEGADIALKITQTWVYID